MSNLPVRPTATHVLRALEVRRNEDLVLAESALLGERRVAWTRLVAILLFGTTHEIVPHLIGRPHVFDGWRAGLGIAYAALGIGSLIALYRLKPNPRSAFVIPFVVTVIDFAFLTAQAMNGYRVEGLVYPEMGAISMAIVVCFSVARFSWLHVLASTVLACASYLFIGLTTRQFDSISTPFVMGGFVALGVLIGLTNASVRRTFSGLRSRDNLTRFLPRQIVDRLLAGGESALRPVQCEVTVLFSDIRDFTSLSEAMPPRDVLEFLDDYFGHMAQVVKGHDGLVNKFLGDGMLAFWGVPDRNPEHAQLAIKAALDMRAKLDEINQSRVNRGETPVRIGIGIHTGTVAAGMLGGADQHEYTIIGDAVNVASRVEGLTKSLGRDILVSETTWARTGGGFRGERVAEEKVKGRAGSVVVYSIESRTPTVALA